MHSLATEPISCNRSGTQCRRPQIWQSGRDLFLRVACSSPLITVPTLSGRCKRGFGDHVVMCNDCAHFALVGFEVD